MSALCFVFMCILTAGLAVPTIFGGPVSVVTQPEVYTYVFEEPREVGRGIDLDNPRIEIRQAVAKDVGSTRILNNNRGSVAIPEQIIDQQLISNEIETQRLPSSYDVPLGSVTDKPRGVSSPSQYLEPPYQTITRRFFEPSNNLQTDSLHAVGPKQTFVEPLPTQTSFFAAQKETSSTQKNLLQQNISEQGSPIKNSLQQSTSKQSTSTPSTYQQGTLQQSNTQQSAPQQSGSQQSAPQTSSQPSFQLTSPQQIFPLSTQISHIEPNQIITVQPSVVNPQQQYSGFLRTSSSTTAKSQQNILQNIHSSPHTTLQTLSSTHSSTSTSTISHDIFNPIIYASNPFLNSEGIKSSVPETYSINLYKENPFLSPLILSGSTQLSQTSQSLRKRAY